MSDRDTPYHKEISFLNLCYAASCYHRTMRLKSLGICFMRGMMDERLIKIQAENDEI